jgi:uncharacterized protein YgiM (DUF1202 family)
MQIMNRRSFIRTLPALAALAAVPALALARTTAREGVVTTSALNVRSGPGAWNAQLGVVRRGERVRINNYADGWYEISTPYVSGWASSSYIQPVDGYDNDRPHHDDRPRHDERWGDDDRGYAKPPPGRFAVIGRNRRGYVNMFDGPGREYRVIAQLSEGERVRVIEEGREWTLVGKRDTGRGYVRSRSLEYYR